MSGIGVNLRVTGHCSQGGRNYMEDMFSVAYQQTEDENELEYAFFGMFDGHGGEEAATYAKEHLLDSIVQQKSFWSDNDEDVLQAIHEGYINTHQAMWKDQVNWKCTASGLPSTSGTTATVAFIMKSKIYIGHVGDSMLVLGYHDEDEKKWKCLELTKEHKPEAPEEIKRISETGGKVVRKNGVPRVVWNRPKNGHKGPVRRSTAFDEIPFLAVARALGDFWSYNPDLEKFVVSPEPDVGVIEMNSLQHKCLILGTDGLWNMLSAQDAVDIVHHTEIRNESGIYAFSDQSPHHKDADSNYWLNPSKCLVDKAIDRWIGSRSRADNTSVITMLIDPPGPPPTPKKIKKEDEKLPESGSMAFFARSPGSPKQELINSLFRNSASIQCSPDNKKKERAISNALRPFNEILKARQAAAELDHACVEAGSKPAPNLDQLFSHEHSIEPRTTVTKRSSNVSARSSNPGAQIVSVVAPTTSPVENVPAHIPVIPSKMSAVSLLQEVEALAPPRIPSPHVVNTRSSNANIEARSTGGSPPVATRSSNPNTTSPNAPTSCSLNSLTSPNISATRSSNPTPVPSIPDTHSSNSSPSIPATRSSNPLTSSNVPVTRSTNPTTPPNIPLTRSSNLTPSPIVPSTRSSNPATKSPLTTRSPNPTTHSPCTRRSANSTSSSNPCSLSSLASNKTYFVHRNDCNRTILWKPKSGSPNSGNNTTTSPPSKHSTRPMRGIGRGLVTRALSNQSAGCMSSMSSAKRKRFRMDEKRSSLPLGGAFGESSGNSDTENEHEGGATACTPDATVTRMKKQKLERHTPSAASSSPRPTPGSTSTRTLRSNTVAATQKTLRNRNVNMSPLPDPGPRRTSQPARNNSGGRSSMLASSRPVLSQPEMRPRGSLENLRPRSKR